MNCEPLRSPSKRIVLPGKALRKYRTKALAIAILALCCIGSAFASPGTLVTNGANQPNGAIVWNGSVWIADLVFGFCRIDAGVINQATCFVTANGQPELNGNIVYITDQTGGTGVWRLTMNAVTSTIDSAVVLAPNGGLARTFSFVPFTAPITMGLRVTATEVPALDIALSAALIVLTIWLLIKLSTKLFRFGLLIYGKRPGFGETLRWLRQA